MQQLQLSRRHFLQLTLGAGVAWAVGIPTGNKYSSTAHPLLIHLATLLPHQQSARLIGERYLQRYPHEAHIAHLLATLTATNTLTDARSVQQSIAQQIRTDFATEQIVKVQGWLLSHTEARLCALAVLAHR